MFGKVFDNIYDGSLHGHWEAIITMKVLVVLADQDGIVDKTPKALSDRTSIPLEIIERGLIHLSQPDPYSRSPDEEGRRIVPLDPARPWGWRIVNYKHYRALRSAEERREYHRQYWHTRKDSTVLNNDSTNSTNSSKQKQYAEEETTLSGKPDIEDGLVYLKAKALRVEAESILTFLNDKTGKAYRPVKANLDLILARLKEGYSPTDLRQVVAKKCREWIGDETMEKYLRPATLFNRTKFAQYAGELVKPKDAQ